MRRAVPSVKVTVEVVVPTPMLVRQLIDKLRVEWNSPEATSAAFGAAQLPVITTPSFHRQMFRVQICCTPPSPPPPSPPPSPPPPSPPPSSPPDMTAVAAASASAGVIGLGILGGVIFLALSAQAARRARALARKRARARLKKSFAALSSASKSNTGKGGLADIAMLSQLGKGGVMNVRSMVGEAKHAIEAASSAAASSSNKVHPSPPEPFGAPASPNATRGDDRVVTFVEPLGGGGGQSAVKPARPGPAVRLAWAQTQEAKPQEAKPQEGARQEGARQEGARQLGPPGRNLNRRTSSFVQFKSFVLRRPPPPKLGSARIGKDIHGGAGKNLLSEKEMARRRKERDKLMAKRKRERDRAKRQAVKDLYAAPIEVDEYGFATGRRKWDDWREW